MSSLESEGRAASINGRAFDFRAPNDESLDSGAFVAIRSGDLTVVGQVRSIEPEGSGLSGSGSVLGVVDREGVFSAATPRPFAAAPFTVAERVLVDAMHASHRAELAVGTIIGTDAFDVRLLAHRFNRHTFWCGQSGSGKTYALGVVLEELLLKTALPMVVLDPNADFVRMREAMDPAGPHSTMLTARDIRVLGTGADAIPLRARFRTMTTRARAAVLRLDPLADRDEYNDLVHLDATRGATDVAEITANLRAADIPGTDELAARIENLSLDKWSVWAGVDRAASEIIDERPDATVLDLGGFEYPDEALVVALSVLDDLWERRSSRRPILIVIDEAHNFCSPDNDGPLARAVRERLIQIAAEGRKFGLWLLLSTQRPSKIDPNILSQCDNLALMKLSSPGDLTALAKVFGFAPVPLLERAPLFRQGEALFAGGFVPAPVLVRLRTRLTHEGGADVAVPMRPAGPG